MKLVFAFVEEKKERELNLISGVHLSQKGKGRLIKWEWRRKREGRECNRGELKKGEKWIGYAMFGKGYFFYPHNDFPYLVCSTLPEWLENDLPPLPPFITFTPPPPFLSLHHVAHLIFPINGSQPFFTYLHIHAPLLPLDCDPYPSDPFHISFSWMYIHLMILFIG